MNGAVGEVARSRQAKGMLMFLGLAWLVWVLSNWILNGSVQYLELGSMAIGMVIVTVSILNDWRSGFFLFIVWLLFEDLARKYLGNGTILFFGKDLLAAIIWTALLAAKRRREVKFFRAPFFVPFALFFSLAVIQVFNTRSPNILYGLLGLKLYFYYVPLMFVGYAMLRNGRDLDRFLLFNVFLGFVIAFLGIVQSVVGLKFLNPAVLDSNLEELGNLTRYSPLTHRAVLVPDSVFVSGGRYSIYMILVVILAMGTQAYVLLTRRKGAFYGFLGVGLALVGAMQSGSRGSIVYTVTSILVISAAILWGAPWRWGQGHRMVKAVRQSLLIGAVGLFLMVQLFPDSIGASWAFFSETLDPRSSASEVQNRAWDYPLLNLEYAFGSDRWPIGDGTGTASLGMQYVTKLIGKEVVMPPTVENGYGQLILELGILGPILWILWTTVFLISAWKIVRDLRETVYFPVAFSIFWFSFLLLVPLTIGGIDPYENFVMNAYFWILAGVLYRLPYLARMPQTVPSQAKVPKLVGVQNVPSFARVGR